MSIHVSKHKRFKLVLRGGEIEVGQVRITDVRNNNSKVAKSISPFINWIKRSSVKEINYRTFLVDKYYIVEI